MYVRASRPGAPMVKVLHAARGTSRSHLLKLRHQRVTLKAKLLRSRHDD
jgi:hypothetical protein